jgi:hypothetical protein
MGILEDKPEGLKESFSSQRFEGESSIILSEKPRNLRSSSIILIRAFVRIPGNLTPVTFAFLHQKVMPPVIGFC